VEVPAAPSNLPNTSAPGGTGKSETGAARGSEATARRPKRGAANYAGTPTPAVAPTANTLQVAEPNATTPGLARVLGIMGIGSVSNRALTAMNGGQSTVPGTNGLAPRGSKGSRWGSNWTAVRKEKE